MLTESPAFHVTGIDAGIGEPVDLWVSAGSFVAGPVADAVRVTGWVLPGLVDAHCHIGYSTQGVVSLDEAEQQARTNLAAGALALRDCGSPLDTRPLVGRDDLPVLIRAGRHIARPKRYIRELGVDVEPDSLVDQVREQLAYGGGWIKIVGDWIDRGTGDLAPLWPEDVLREAISAAHAGGARVTTHVFGEQGLAQMLNAGVDCVEHGTGLTAGTIEVMAARGVHLVPTLINIANFPSFADAAGRFPSYARHMRSLHARSTTTYADAVDAGVMVHAGTDAGGFIEHGRIVEEVQALAGIGLDPRTALRHAAHDARHWLGLGSYRIGDDADLVVYPVDPGADRKALAGLVAPSLILRSGVARGRG